MAKDLPKLKAPSIDFGSFFGRFHAVIFAVGVCGGLAVGIYLLTGLLNESSTMPDGYVPPATDTSFDTSTIERVEQLRPLSVSPTAPELPEGRIDPFPQ